MNSNTAISPKFQIHVNKDFHKKEKSKKIPVNDITIDFSQIHFPVFTYKKASTFMNDEIKNISLLIDHIDELNRQIIETNKQIEITGNKVNMFINNSFSPTPKFSYKKHFLAISNNEIKIHRLVDLDKVAVLAEINELDIESQEDLFETLPKTKLLYKVNSKQLKLCQKLYDMYNSYNEQLQYIEERIDSASELYNLLIEKVTEELMYLEPINLTTDSKPQIFDPEIHDIIATKNRKSLMIVYTELNNRNVLIQQLQQQLI